MVFSMVGVSVKFKKPLNRGIFQRRYKRFFVDIEFEGEIITAHCPNTGSMMGLEERGQVCLFSKENNPKRKLQYTLQMVKSGEGWIGVNTGLPNKLVKELFEEKPLKHWEQFNEIQGEVKISEKSRIDLVLWNSGDHCVKRWNFQNLMKPLHLIEVKNVTLGKKGVAFFPDAVTTRGQKHLEELVGFTRKGFSCEILFVVQRMDCKVFKVADYIDSEYGKKLRKAEKAGVRITVLPCKMNQNEVVLNSEELKIKL